MLVVVWEYRAWESFYRPDGPWAELFRECPAYISTTLMKDLRDPQRFMVADRWTSELVYEEFKRAEVTRYDELSTRGARLYDREHEVGRFDFLD